MPQRAPVRVVLLQVAGLCGLALTLVMASATASAATTIDDIDVVPAGSTTRVVFHTSSTPKFSYFELNAPTRGVLDFDATKAASGIDGASGGSVQRIRLANKADGSLRVVLDLTAGAHLDNVASTGAHEITARVSGGSSVASSQKSAQQTGATSQSAASSARADTSSGSRIESDAAAGVPKAVYRAAAETGPIVVVIDPGHGGHDSGTVSASGLQEKTVALAIAKRLYSRLKATSSMKSRLISK